MDYRPLSNTGLDVSAICFGAWQMGARGWGDVSEADTITAARRACDLGVNIFDTADIYGLGHSEEILGPVVRDLRAAGKDVLLATKGGRRWDDSGRFWTDASPKWLHQAIDDSLQRLGLDCVDLYQLHWPDPQVPFEDSVGALKEIRDAGKARFVGVCNCGLDELATAISVAQVVSNQVPLNMFYREYEPDILPVCKHENIAVLTYGPLAQGLLSGRYDAQTRFPEDDVRSQSKLYQGEAFLQNLAFVDALRPIAERAGKTVAQVAINWVLAHAAVTSAICGSKRPDQIDDSVGASGWELPLPDLWELRRILPESYPSPRPLA